MTALVTGRAPSAATSLAPWAGGRSRGLGPRDENGCHVLHVRTVQVAGGYEPAHAVVRAGTPVRWEIDSQAASCAASISARDLGLPTFVLDPGVNAVAFTPPEPGRYRYSCAMGMYWGSLTVIAADA